MDASLVSVIKKWQDPRVLVRELFKVQPDPWQDDALYYYWKYSRLAMSASKGPGKTTTLSWIAWHFLLTRPNPKIAATSVTRVNLADGLWTEMAKWQQKAPILQHLFRWTKSRIELKESPETWYMSARSWSKSADAAQQADTLAGLHADNLLFLIDEVGGVPDAVLAAAEAGLANDTGTDPTKRARLVIAGNPTHTEGPLYRAVNQERRLWKVVEINADPDNPKRSPRVSIEWAKAQIEKYGKDNPWVLVNVFGRFPPASINSLVSLDEVRDAMRRSYQPHQYGWAQKRLGIDVARFGDDRSIIIGRQGLVAFKPVELRNARTTDIAARVINIKDKWGSEAEFVDDTGHWGHGVIDNLMTAHATTVLGIQFHAPALNPRYKNRRAEMWFEMAEWIKRGGSIPNIPDLAGELTTPTYTYSNGKILLEDKDQIKERLGRSPDIADALALTFALPDQPGTGLKETYFDTHRRMQEAAQSEEERELALLDRDDGYNPFHQDEPKKPSYDDYFSDDY